MVTLKTALADSTNVENITATGSITSQKVGVFAYLSAPASTTTTLASTYYPINGTFVNDPIECFGAATVYTPGIKYTCTNTQYLEIDWHASVYANANNVTVDCAVFKNGVLLPGSIMETFCKNINQVYALSGTVVVELATNDEIQLVVSSNSAGAILTFEHYTTSISEFFD